MYRVLRIKPFVLSASLTLAGGSVPLAGCGPAPRNPIPVSKAPPPIKPRNWDPCTRKKFPKLVIAAPQHSLEKGKQTLARIEADLRMITKINPRFVCGLDRIELLEPIDLDPNARLYPHGEAHYDWPKPVIQIKHYSTLGLVHMIGHHIYHTGSFDLPEQFSTNLLYNYRLHLSPLPQRSQLLDRVREEWAIIFSASIAYPMEAALRAYLEPHEPPDFKYFGRVGRGTALSLGWIYPDIPRESIDLVYDKVHSPLPIQAAKAVIGNPVLGPRSETEIFDGKSLWLQIDAGTDPNKPRIRLTKWLRLNLDTGKIEETRSDFPVYPPIAFSPGESFSVSGVSYTERLDNYLIIANRGSGYSPRTTRSPGAGFTVVDLKNGGQTQYLDDDAWLGQFLRRGDKLSYFKRIPDGLEMKTFDPKNGDLQSVRQWETKGVLPVHVVPLDGEKDLAVLAAVENSEDEFQLLRIKQTQNNAPSKPRFKIHYGDRIRIPPHRQDLLRPPFKLGEKLLFPLSSFHFIGYDLNADRFSLINPDFEGDPMLAYPLREVIQHNGQLYAIAKSKDDDNTHIVPFTMNW